MLGILILAVFLNAADITLSLKTCSDCMAYTSCEEAKQLAFYHKSPKTATMFREAFCGFEYIQLERVTKVCCSDFTLSGHDRSGMSGFQNEKKVDNPQLKLLPAPCGDIDGCGCHTYQFGCCPDGVTVATGPNLQGCLCHQSKYGCCGDEVTPAKGPDGAGCDCSTSKYGCCPDGVTEAAGEKFLNCTDAPENKQASCSLANDRGTCRNFSVQYYYDMTYGDCQRFWYGGCEGNGNRFNSQEECEDVCVHPSPKDACNLPKVKGGCQDYFVRWYYDSAREQCSQFVFGGCLGNANNFESLELCQQHCEPEKTEDQCNQPISPGSCAGNFLRWGYDAGTRRCSQFIWGGCEGNANRFGSEAACLQRCNPPGAPQSLYIPPTCKDNPFFADCSLIVRSNYCNPKYYSRFCCKSCVEAGQLDPMKLDMQSNLVDRQ